MTTLLHSMITQILLTVVLSGASVAKVWIGYRNEIRIEQLRNRRLASALRSTAPGDRNGIITACAYLEAAVSQAPGQSGAGTEKAVQLSGTRRNRQYRHPPDFFPTGESMAIKHGTTPKTSVGDDRGQAMAP